ncbi:hypothetical protein FRC14_002259 [Serendipita sp. 396]|nr:hypothetical protein FRC14_002259 [Serendipita sp. 396]
MVTLKPTVSFFVFFPLFAAAAWSIIGQLISSGAHKAITQPDDCPFPPKYLSASQIRHTGISAIDQAACLGVELTKVALFRDLQPFTVYFLSSLSSVFMVINIEGLREDGPSTWFPALVTSFSMMSAAGIVVPLAWLFIFALRRRESMEPLTRPTAEGLFLSLILGYLLPLAVMISTTDEYAILSWAFSGIFMVIIQRLWASIRPPTGQAGFFTTQLGLLTTLLISSFIHLTMMFNYAPKITGESLLQWLPTWTTGNPKYLTTEAIVLQFLQWDFLFTFVASIFAGVFYTDSWPELLLYAMATPMVLLALGPGAVVSAMWMWREWKLTMLKQVQTDGLQTNEKKDQ